MRFVEGAPLLETLVNGVPTGLGLAYLAVDGRTVASSFNYGSVTPFVTLPAGAASVEALDSLGYSVGPLTTTTMVAGKSYTVIVVGSYPSYRALAFAEPAPSDGATLAIYEASPALPSVDFGRFAASKSNGFVKLGSAHLGEIATASLGKSATNVGGYVGKGVSPVPNGTLVPHQIDEFDGRNALPYHAASRLSLFVVDPSGSGLGPVFGSLDQ